MSDITTFINDIKVDLKSWEQEIHGLEIRISELGEQAQAAIRSRIIVLRADWYAFVAKVKAWEARLEAKLSQGWDVAKSEWDRGYAALEADWNHLVEEIRQIKTEIESKAA